MIKKLVKHGNSHALVIEKPILELLNFDADTPLSITTDGNCLVVSKAKSKEDRQAFLDALEEGNRKFGKMLQRLAQ